MSLIRSVGRRAEFQTCNCGLFHHFYLFGLLKIPKNLWILWILNQHTNLVLATTAPKLLLKGVLSNDILGRSDKCGTVKLVKVAHLDKLAMIVKVLIIVIMSEYMKILG